MKPLSFTVDGDRSGIVHTFECVGKLEGESLPAHFATLPRRDDSIESATVHKVHWGDYRLKLYVAEVVHGRGYVRVFLAVSQTDRNQYAALVGKPLE